MQVGTVTRREALLPHPETALRDGVLFVLPDFGCPGSLAGEQLSRQLAVPYPCAHGSLPAASLLPETGMYWDAATGGFCSGGTWYSWDADKQQFVEWQQQK